MRIEPGRRPPGMHAVCALVVALLVWPSGLAGKERRGADVVVTRLDGSLIQGELIAVKTDSLLLLSREGRDESVGLADVKSVRIVRKSHAVPFGLAGLLAGAVTGVMYGSDPDMESGELTYGALFGGIGALAAFALSQVLATDITLAVAGEPDAVVNGYRDRLRSYSRVGRSPGDETRAPATKRPEDVVIEPRPRPVPAPRHGPRFRFSLSGLAQSPKRWPLPDGGGSFRLPDEPSPDQGPHPVSFYRSHQKSTLSGIALGVAYEWKERLLVEIELFDLGESVNYLGGELIYTSATDGKLYVCEFFRGFRARFTGLMAGLTYRTDKPAPFRRHIFEFGAAAGPALVRGRLAYREVPGGSPYGVANPIGGHVVLSARVSAAYDYYLYPNMSIGAVAAYRLMERDLSGRVSDGDEFFVENGDYSQPLTRRFTEISFPELPVKLGGFSWGLRVSFRI